MRYLLLLILLPFITQAQNENTAGSTQGTYSSRESQGRGSFYLSWGYNTEWYTRSNVKVNQSELGNDYSLENVKGHDHRGWDEGLFSKPITIPQYNYRIGYFFSDKHDLGVEINFDHTKYILEQDQQLGIKGTLNGKSIDSTITFNEANGFFYYLNNGANFLLFNLVKRWHCCNDKSGNIKTDFLLKGGVGPVIPHVENSFFGQKNEPHFQIGGWNMGTEVAVRTTFYKHVYLEFAGKLDYARYSNLMIYKGTVKHAFGTAEFILNLGYTFNAGKKK